MLEHFLTGIIGIFIYRNSLLACDLIIKAYKY